MFVINVDSSPIGVCSSLDIAGQRVREYADSLGCEVTFFDDGSFTIVPEGDDGDLAISYGAIYEFAVDGEV